MSAGSLATGDLHRAITIAIAVLIITCPCALGLAVPMVQVVAARRLFESGIMVKDGGALERLAEIDTVVFDKTGTLTSGVPRLVGSGGMDHEAVADRRRLWLRHSRHPYSRALVEAAAGHPASSRSSSTTSPSIRDADLRRTRERLPTGSAGRIGRLPTQPTVSECRAMNPSCWQGMAAVWRTFALRTGLRADAAAAVAELKDVGLPVEIVSGDRETSVGPIAAELGVPYFAAVLPGGKAAHIAALEASGRKVLMVGDGLNDAPALAAAHASMAPASAADVGRNAADLVFLRESLSAVPLAISVARKAGRLVRQNFALAVAYNVIAMPIAIMGHVTPLLAAIAMSGSSIAGRRQRASPQGPAKDRGQRRPRTHNFRPRPFWRPPNDGLLST